MQSDERSWKNKVLGWEHRPKGLKREKADTRDQQEDTRDLLEKLFPAAQIRKNFDHDLMNTQKIAKSLNISENFEVIHKTTFLLNE